VYSISHEPELNYETSTLGTADMPRGTKIKNVQTDPGSAFPRTSPLRNQGWPPNMPIYGTRMVYSLHKHLLTESEHIPTELGLAPCRTSLCSVCLLRRENR